MGGDELNIPQAGANYGWPVVSWGSHYTGEDIPDPPTHPEFADAIYHWNPVISPSGVNLLIPPTPFQPGRVTSSSAGPVGAGDRAPHP